MSETLPLFYATRISLVLLVVAVLLTLWRSVRGPDLPDRVVALDTFGMIMIGMLAISSIQTDQTVLVDIIFVIAMISFLGTVAFAHYLETKKDL